MKHEDAKIIEANDYVITKQKWEIEELKKEKPNLEKELSDIMVECIENQNKPASTSSSQVPELELTESRPKLPMTFELKDFKGL